MATPFLLDNGAFRLSSVISRLMNLRADYWWDAAAREWHRRRSAPPKVTRNHILKLSSPKHQKLAPQLIYCAPRKVAAIH